MKDGVEQCRNIVQILSAFQKRVAMIMLAVMVVLKYNANSNMIAIFAAIKKNAK